MYRHPYVQEAIEHSKDQLDNFRDEDTGKFIGWSILGGYPAIYYADGVGDVCHVCANDSERKRAKGMRDGVEEIVAARLYYEGPVIQCEWCNADLESAYGDPEEDADELEVDYDGPYYRCCNDNYFYRPGDVCGECGKEVEPN